MLSKKIGILGGGLAGLSLAYFLKEESVAVVEKNRRPGGLMRSFTKKGVTYDLGPHIIFSKNQEALDFLNRISLNDRHRRANRIFHRGRYIKYPFENHLAQLNDPQEIDYCLNTFLNNPYERLPAANLLAFFLKTFGEGITRLYLEPYNQKIWKFDPCMMDTQMVARLPRPPKRDIINSARGKFSEGYLHQLYFTYPRKGGIQSVIKGLMAGLRQKNIPVLTGTPVKSLSRDGSRWTVRTPKGLFKFDALINCMPLHELLPALPEVPEDIRDAARNLKFNSIYLVMVNVQEDRLGDNFAVMLAQKDVIFHRLSKLDFMGGRYHLPGSATLLLEITFRPGDLLSRMKPAHLISRCLDDLVRVGFIPSRDAVNFTDFRKEKYAYVIYDLNHRHHADKVLDYLKSQGITCHGRFARFEYLNMDRVVEDSMNLAREFNLRMRK